MTLRTSMPALLVLWGWFLTSSQPSVVSPPSIHFPLYALSSLLPCHCPTIPNILLQSWGFDAWDWFMGGTYFKKGMSLQMPGNKAICIFSSGTLMGQNIIFAQCCWKGGPVFGLVFTSNHITSIGKCFMMTSP